MIVVWNTRYLTEALDHLRQNGYLINDDDLQHVTPLLWEHITIHGSYHFDLTEPGQQNGMRPLRVRSDLRTEELPEDNDIN